MNAKFYENKLCFYQGVTGESLYLIKKYNSSMNILVKKYFGAPSRLRSTKEFSTRLERLRILWFQEGDNFNIVEPRVVGGQSSVRMYTAKLIECYSEKRTGEDGIEKWVNFVNLVSLENGVMYTYTFEEFEQIAEPI